MKRLLYVLTGLCLLAGVFTGCEDPLKDPDSPNGGGSTSEQTDLQIQDINGEVIDELAIEDNATQGVFVLKNTGAKIIEWEIPKLAVDWISDFSMQSGKLAQGASDRVEFSIDRSKLSAGANETTLYIGSNVGDKELLIKVGVERSFCFFDGSREEIIEVDMSGTDSYRFQIKNTGNDALQWSLGEIDADWLTFEGETEGKLAAGKSTWRTLKKDRTQLAEGLHESTLVFHSNAGEKTLPVKVKIEMGIRLENTDGAEISELDLGNELRGVFNIKNTGNGVLKYTVSYNKDWLAVVGENTGMVPPDATATIEFRIDWNKLPEGTDEAILTIGSAAGDRQLPIRVSKYVVGTVGSDYVETAFDMQLQMVAVQGGAFQMGATEEQGSDASDCEKPVHSVVLDGFYIGKYEVTQTQWEAVMGTTVAQQEKGSHNLDYWGLYGVGDNYPMYYVRWWEAVKFCEKLSQMTGKTYRLPTEAEWEYAARGGQHADGTKYAGSNDISAWYNYNSGRETHPVGQKQANGLGLYDMSGNVAEWCSDWYGKDYYSSSPVVNPQGPSSGSANVIRGGGWSHYAVACRVSYRSYADPWYCGPLGFRVACSAE